ncbi:MAG: hypothetical protein ACI9SK_000490 [Zhongshania sp.]|jgi:hypothetical protein
MARNAIDVTRGILPLGLKAAPRAFKTAILPFCLARFASNGAGSVPRGKLAFGSNSFTRRYLLQCSASLKGIGVSCEYRGDMKLLV